jgi:spore germination protein GerM
MSNNNQPKSIGFTLGIITAILIAGTGAAWWAFQSLTSSPTRSPNLETVNPSLIPEKPKVVQKPQSNLIQSQAKVYWLSPKADNLDFVATSVSVQKSANKDQVLQTALEQLLSQTPNAPATTAIPTGTQLLSLKVNSQGVYLNLSAAFTQGGGSESMAGRLGQVLYTASSLDPNMPVWISVEGKPLETLGGEGLMIDQPITRQWFKENFEM